MAKWFEGKLSEMAAQGLDELRDANAGKFAMNAPLIVEAPAIEAPAVEQTSFVEALNRDARADTRDDRSQELSR